MKTRIIGCFFLISLSIYNMQAENDKVNYPIASIGNTTVFLNDLISDDQNTRKSIREELEMERMSSEGKIKFEINDDLIDKYIFTLQKLILKDMLKKHVDEAVLKKEIDQIVPKSEIDSYFVQQMEGGIGAKKEYLYYKALVDAYEYLDQHPGQEKAVEDAYDKFLAQTIGKFKTREKGLTLWKSYVNADGARKMFENDFYNAKNLLSGKISKEMREKKKQDFFNEKPRREAYILKKCAQTNEKLKIYLEEKNKTGKSDKAYEQSIINNWYLQQLNILDCKILTDKYGSLENIMNSDENEFEKLLNK